MPAPPPTSRLLRAVVAERDELDRHRARMTEEADELRRALARIERGLMEIDERRVLLDQLLPPAADGTVEGRTRARARTGAGSHDRAGGYAGVRSDEALLRGPEIRAAAVRILLERGREAMHYRDWYALLQERGLGVAGKAPLAVFLTQLGRSPAVRRGAEAGVYELDRHAAARHRAKLEGLQRELRELTMVAGGARGRVRGA